MNPGVHPATDRVDAIAFDLDGTLVDSAGGVAHALNAALAGVGLPAFDLATVRGWIGGGPDVLIGHALAARACDVGDPDLAQRLRRDFDAATRAAPMAHSAVFDGIADVLAALASRHRLAVATNKPTSLACAVLEAAGLLGHFASVRGADTPALRKPSPLSLQQAADAMGCATARMLMVGDAPVDIAAAHAAGCRAAWAGWGYGPAPSAAEAGPALWSLRVPRDLLALVPAPAPAPAPAREAAPHAARHEH
jgi:phosphoglycolate phosphatase